MGGRRPPPAADGIPRLRQVDAGRAVLRLAAAAGAGHAHPGPRRRPAARHPDGGAGAPDPGTPPALQALAAGEPSESPENWAMDRFTVARQAVLRDPSMLAQGLSGNITGARADLIICDDVEVAGNC